MPRKKRRAPYSNDTTSKAAAQAIESETEKLRRECWEYVRRNGKTARFELCVTLNRGSRTIDPRVWELVLDGNLKVVEGETRRPPGRDAQELLIAVPPGEEVPLPEITWDDMCMMFTHLAPERKTCCPSDVFNWIAQYCNRPSLKKAIRYQALIEIGCLRSAQQGETP